MAWKTLGLVLMIFCVKASMGCELEAILGSAVECSTEDSLFNITKYTTYIEKLIESGSEAQSIEEFFMNNTIAEMVTMFGELEPAIVWLASSFYDEHLKDLTQEQFVRPMFGNMSNMAQVLTDSLNSHCGILDELMTCFVGKLNTYCSSSSDVARMKSMFLDPFQGVFCSGSTPKQSSKDWLASHSAGLTSAFSCLVDPNHPPERLDFIDFENNPVIRFLNLDRIVSECNLGAMGFGLDEWLKEEGLAALFTEDFNMTTFNIFTLIDIKPELSALRMLRPMADCAVREFLAFGERLCPSMDVTSQVTNIADVFRFMLPMYQSFQETIKQMFLNPLPKPNYASANRQSKAMVGMDHTYNLESDEWLSSCSPGSEDSKILIAWGSGGGYRNNDGSIYVEGLYGDGLLFNNSGIYMQIGDSDDSAFNMMVKFSEVTPMLFFGAPFEWLIETDNTTLFTFMLPSYGVIISLQNPSGSNWVVFVRAGVGAYQLAFGSMAKGCKSDLKSSISESISNTAISQNCTNLCSGVSALVDACQFDCQSGKVGMPAELAAFRLFHNLASHSDRDMINFAANGGAGKYTSCSTVGFVNNSVLPCVWEAMFDGSFPYLNLTYDATVLDWMAEIGVIEPYALYGMSALIKEFVVGPPARGFMGVSTSDINDFVPVSLLTQVVAQHCRTVPEFCPRTQEELLNSYIAPLKTRYCVGTSVKQNVLDEMLLARDDLLDELSCIVNQTNTAQFEFDEAKMDMMYAEMVARCEFDNVLSYVMSWVESEEGQVLNQVKELVRLAKAPMRCIVKVVEGHCTGIDINALVDKLVVHLNRATAGVLGIDRDFFINTKQINYGSKERVSLWAVGDPHIRSLDSDQFTVCDSPGNVTYFSSEEGARFEIKALNDPVSVAADATVIRELYLKAWAPGSAYTEAPMVSYTVKNGTLSTTFDDGQNDVVVGEFSIFIEPRHNGKTVFIQNVNSGTFVVIQPFKTFYNLILRTSRSYAEAGTGLLVSGCGLEGQNITLLNEETEFGASGSRRRKRAVTVEECQLACSSVQEVLREQCQFDCLTMEDTEVGAAHNSVIEVEAEAQVDDVKIQVWLPDLDEITTSVGPSTQEPSAATNVFFSVSLFIFTAMLLLR